jgi:hypothetical protein
MLAATLYHSNVALAGMVLGTLVMLSALVSLVRRGGTPSESTD